MTTAVEIPHVIVRELKDRGFSQMQIREMYKTYVESTMIPGLDEETTLENFETFIDSNRTVLEKTFPALKREVEEYD